MLNVGTTPSAIEVQALAPGLDLDKLEITVDRGLLVIAGDRKSQLPPPAQRVNVYAKLSAKDKARLSARVAALASCSGGASCWKAGDPRP